MIWYFILILYFIFYGYYTILMQEWIFWRILNFCRDKVGHGTRQEVHHLILLVLGRPSCFTLIICGVSSNFIKNLNTSYLNNFKITWFLILFVFFGYINLECYVLIIVKIFMIFRGYDMIYFFFVPVCRQYTSFCFIYKLRIFLTVNDDISKF